MAKVIVLGGCGAVGSVAVRTLAAHDAFDEVVIGDIDTARAEILARELGGGVSALRVDVGDAASVKQAVAGCDVVLNCSGPFYKYVMTTLRAVLDAGVDYVDVCDDVDVTRDVLDLHEQARAAGISALIGMGSSPGVTNLLARFASEALLDETEAVDIYHAHGGEPIEGEGVIAHRFHCMSIDVPMYLDGELKYVQFFGPDGIALRETVDFHRLGTGFQVYPYPHPEQLTIPEHIPLRRVTNRGTVLPDEYYSLIADMCRLGLHDTEPLNVRGVQVKPYDFAIAHILKQRELILERTQFGSQRGCVKVVVSGKKADGTRRSYVFSMASVDQALGEGTGIPAAMGAILMVRGQVAGPGVLPPEACVNPMDFLALIGPVLASSSQGGSYEGLKVEKIDEHGNRTDIDLATFGL
ncbi:MAG: saccharopine dehydrogenase NADP-binding domain-containing protein [bacterium]